MGTKTKQKPMPRGTAPLKLIVMIDSSTYCKYWYIVVGVTIPFKESKRGKKLCHIFVFGSWEKPVSRGIAPVKLIFMIESETYCKYWYVWCHNPF